MNGVDSFLRSNAIILSFVVFAAAFGLRFYNIDYRNVWMDESRQASYSNTGFFNPKIIKLAASQNQPPIDYYLEAIGISLFGLNEIGIRIHAVVMGSLAALIFFLLAMRIARSPAAYLAGTAIFVFHPWLVRYSQEGRPISTSVFFSTLFVYCLVSFLPNRTDIPARKIGVISFIAFTAVQVGFLLSVGFQPVIFIATSAVSLTPMLFRKDMTRKVLLLILSSFVSFAISFNVIQRMVGKASRYLPVSDIGGMPALVFKNLGALSPGSYVDVLFPLVEGYELFVVLSVLLSSLYIVVRRGCKGESHSISLYLLLFLVIFAPFFDLIFKTLVMNKLQLRYYLTMTVVAVASVTLGMDLALSFIKDVFGSRRSLLHASYLGLTAVFLISFYSSGNLMVELYRKKNTEWKPLYDMFKRSETPGTAYMVNLVNIDRWSPGFCSKILYYRKSDPQPVKLKKGDKLVDDLRGNPRWTMERDIYIVTAYGSDKVESGVFDRMVGVSMFNLHGLSAIKINRGSDAKENTVKVFRRLRDQLERDESNYLLYKLLFSIEIGQGNKEEAEKSYRMLREVDKRGKLKSMNDRLEKILRKHRVAKSYRDYR